MAHKAAVRRPKPRVIQYVLSGLSETAPLEPGWRRGGAAAQGLTNEEQRNLRRLRSKARQEGRDPATVSLPPKNPSPLGRVPGLISGTSRPLDSLPAFTGVTSQPSRLDLLPPVHVMEAPALGRAASVAARETAAGPALWAALTDRARELLDSLDTQDLALLLKGMARAQHRDMELAELLLERAESRLAYFDVRHLIMVLSGLAKAGVTVDQLSPVLQELQHRVPEIRGASELSMALAALGRLRREGLEADLALNLVKDLASQVELRLSADRFHSRDLAVVTTAYRQIGYLEPRHMEHVIACSRFTLREAAPRELSQLVIAASESGTLGSAGAAELVQEAAGLVAEKVVFMLPAELAGAAHSFGHAAGKFLVGTGGLRELEEHASSDSRSGAASGSDTESAAGTDAARLRAALAVSQLLQALATQASSRPDGLQSSHVLAILEACARWCLPLPMEELSTLSMALPPSSAEADSRSLRALLRLFSLSSEEVGVAKVGRCANQELLLERLKSLGCSEDEIVRLQC
eukprot:TRINITY_DN37599_c0_g1_i1.p1 TRINITY_DN37599_c0_g1~~TRINITY_DN37599_c0_g1_i1.p1  ORF type:complete len:523 (+),score=112.96 TRINITY_DN37599_c0_g1_i1:76-1644(+)